jgi:uncharacterized membrane protein
MSSEIKIILLAMTPINELRGTIPLAITAYHFSPWQALLLAVVGNMVPIIFLLWLWPRIASFFQFLPLAKKLLNWLFERTRKKFYKKYSLYGDLALVLFVAIPLPFTGAWSGSIAAFLFGIPFWRALGLIFLGVILAGIVVTLTTTGFFSLIKVI